MFMLIGIACVIIVACSTVSPYQGGDPRWADFKTWAKVNGDEVGTGDPTGFLGSVHKGRNGYREIYVNQTGYDVNQSRGPYKYPVGTVIVKEQFDDRAAWESKQPTELTIMLKLRDNGNLDASNWGWVSGYQGKVTNSGFCSGCHTLARDRDFVFINKEFLTSSK